MDAYLKNKKTKLEVKDLHLIGVTAMFAAAKYEEIHPVGYQRQRSEHGKSDRP